MQKHVKARDAGKRIHLIVILYEVCLFLFLQNVVFKNIPSSRSWSQYSLHSTALLKGLISVLSAEEL